MLQWNPKSPHELPPTAEVLKSREREAQEATEERFQKYLRRRRRWIAAGKVATFAALFLDVHASLYLSDVRNNMLAADEAQPTVAILQDAPDTTDPHQANIYFDGFNTYSADYLVKKLGPGYQEAFDGENWSVRYNNAVLNSAQLSDIVQEKFASQNITSTDFVSYSMGDVPMVDVAVDTIANTWVDIENINIISGPANFDSLTNKTKDELSTAKSLAVIPWIEYSSPFRYVLEAYFYRNDIEKNAWNAIDGINTRFNNGNITTNAFLASQINSVSDSNIPDKILEIGKYADTKHMPNINVIIIANEKDTVVDNAKSAEAICAAALKARLHCTISSVDSRHALYFQQKSIDQYNESFQEIAATVQPYTTQEQTRHALSLYDYYQQDTLVLNR